jgi:hypothetical protein
MLNGVPVGGRSEGGEPGGGNLGGAKELLLSEAEYLELPRCYLEVRNRAERVSVRVGGGVRLRD